MNKNDLIVVTGAGGFIGGHLVGELIHRGYTNLRAVDIKVYSKWWQWHKECSQKRTYHDLSKKEVCDDICNGAKIVYNLAADMGGIGFIEKNKALCMLSVLINTHMLMAAKQAGVQKYFYASSACVYNSSKQADPNVTALREVDAYPALPEEGYGWEKLFSERMCQHFDEDYSLKCMIGRYHNIYGPHGTWKGGREKAPAAFCRKIAEAKIKGLSEIDVWGDGRQTRSFTYIDDCIEGTLRLVDSPITQPLNIGSDELVSIDQLIDIIEEIAGTKLERKYDPSAPHGVRGRNSDNTKIKECLNWAPSIKLKDGLEKTYAWVYDKCMEEIKSG